MAVRAESLLNKQEYNSSRHFTEGLLFYFVIAEISQISAEFLLTE